MTSMLNDDIDQLQKAVEWAEEFPRDKDSWNNVFAKLRCLRQDIDIVEAKWQQLNKQPANLPLPLLQSSSSDWSPDTLRG